MITERIDAITKVPPEYLADITPAPKSVKIELTGRCNYRCGFCALRNRAVQPKGDIDWGLFQRITTEMREAGVQEIGCFYLGESFMAPELLARAIDWCKQELQFPYVFLTSNASLATPEHVEAVMTAGLDSLKWSVNASGETQFSSVMGVATRWYYKALENIKTAHAIREQGYRTKLYASSIRYDGIQQAQMEALLQAHILPYVDQHYWLPLYSMGAQATEREAELGYRPTAGNQGRLGALREPLPCWAVMTEGHVTADGMLSACCFDADGRFAMADLNKTDFLSGWRSERFLKLRAAHRKKDVSGTICEGCVAYA